MDLVNIILYAAMVLGVAAQQGTRCVSCDSDRIEECLEGSEAVELEEQFQECSSSRPYCEVFTREQLGDGPDAPPPHLQSVTRGCYPESSFNCTTDGNVRRCRATCRGDLCNVFEDAPARVAAHEAEEAAAAAAGGLSGGAIAGLVVAALVLLLVAALVIWRLAGRRHKARDLEAKVGAGETAQPLQTQHDTEWK